jgi:alpha/beta superfamily hydrolase
VSSSDECSAFAERELAAALGSAGMVTFRYDKRGVATSTGRWRMAGFYADLRLCTLRACRDSNPKPSDP